MLRLKRSRPGSPDRRAWPWRRIKAGLNHAAESDLAGALDFEAINQDACFHSRDFTEGVTAFMQKRAAVFG
jgi:enoyl-CoA hydratase/carnithine racemase